MVIDIYDFAACYKNYGKQLDDMRRMKT